MYFVFIVFMIVNIIIATCMGFSVMYRYIEKYVVLATCNSDIDICVKKFELLWYVKYRIENLYAFVKINKNMLTPFY